MERKFFFGKYDFFKEIFFKDFDVLFKIIKVEKMIKSLLFKSDQVKKEISKKFVVLRKKGMFY